MKTWTPFIISLVLAILIIAFPLFMAFVVGDEGWVEVGGFLEIILIPAGAGLSLAGLIISLVLYFRRRAA